MGNYFPSAPELLPIRLISGEPVEELWFPEGSAATLEEVLASIESWPSPSLRERPEHDRPRRYAHTSVTSLERWAPSRTRTRTIIKTASMAELGPQNGAPR